MGHMCLGCQDKLVPPRVFPSSARLAALDARKIRSDRYGMSRKRNAVAGLCLAAALCATPCFGQIDSVFGIRLGQRSGLSLCPTDWSARPEVCALSIDQFSPFYRIADYEISFQAKTVPSWVDGVYANSHDVRGVEIITIRIAKDQGSEAIAALSKKYGKPTHQSSEILQNAFGATIRQHYVEWKLEQVVATVITAGGIDQRGHVTIRTREEHDRREALRSEENAKKRPL